MLVIEHFVVTVMDVIKRGYIFYEIHFAKMEKKERAEAKALFDGKDGFDMQPEWATRKDVYKGEKPNTLYVGLSRARDLAIKDHYLIMRGGTSDPQMNFSLVTPQGTVEKHSSCKYRTLKPQWNEDFVFPQVTPPDEVDIISKFFFGADEDPTEDKDPDLDVEISAEIKFTFRDDFIFYFLTVCVVEIPNVRGKTVPEPQEEEGITEDGQAYLSWALHKPSAKKSSEEEDDPKGRRGKPLKRKEAKDVTSKKQQKQWRLSCDLVDIDQASAADSLGAVTIDVLPLRNHELYKAWHLLKKPNLHAADDVTIPSEVASDAFFWDDDAAEADGKVSGDVELLLRWLYEPDEDPWTPSFPKSTKGGPTFNEVQIGLFKARELPAFDANVLTANSSDPFFTFQVISLSGDDGSKQVESTTKYQTLFPVYREDITIRGGPWSNLGDLVLRVTGQDYDLTSATDNLGVVDIPLLKILDEQQDQSWRAWHTLILPPDLVPVNQKDIERRGNPKAQVELFLKLGFNDEPTPAPQTCMPKIFGAPPCPELADGREETVPPSPPSPPRVTTAELTAASKNAAAFKDVGQLTDLVKAYKGFLCDPANRQACLDLASRLRLAILAHRQNASNRSFRLQLTNLVRFPFIIRRSHPRQLTGTPPLTSLTSWRMGFLVGRRLDNVGAPPAAETQDDVRPTVKKASKTSFVATHAFMADLEKSVSGLVQNIVDVTELYNDLMRMNDKWNDALKALAFVENTIPEVVSALETIQSIIQVILKAIQGISFPPNPAVLVDLLHTARSIMKQGRSVYKVYCRHSALTKAVGVLTLFAKHLVDAIARVANLLADEDGDGLCGAC